MTTVQKTEKVLRKSGSGKTAITLMFVTFALLIGAPVISAQTMITAAGNGTAGYNGEALLATSASLNRPKGIAFDAAGNIYVADSLNNRVRRISANGTIATIAGTGTAGYSGDAGLATQAMLNQPIAVAVDASGNVIIADASNRRIRQINASTGLITTIAGTGVEGYSGDLGVATSAMIRRPVDLAVDAGSNIYFADSVDHRIRRISSGGIITTVAGTGTAGFSGDGSLAVSAMLNTPVGIALDASSVLIADAGNHRIRRLTLNTGVMSTFAGNGVGGGTDTGSFSGDGGGAISAGLNTPEGVAVDASGNVYIADMANYRVRKVTASTGVITTIAGTGSDGFSGDGSVATSAQFNLPWSVSVNASGNVFVGDLANNRVREIVVNSEPATYSFAQFAIGGGWQTTLTFANYSAQAVTCQTTFLSDSGGSLLIPFGGVSISSRTDILQAAGTLHAQTNADDATPVTSGWAQAQCTAPVKASVLYRFYQNGKATGEASVNGMASPATKFVTFAQTETGVAYANPSAIPAQVTLSAFDGGGSRLATRTISLGARAHGAATMAQLFGISFSGSLQVASTIPIVSVTINLEVFPVFSSLPPGELDNATVLAGEVPLPSGPATTNTYFFPHIAFGGGWQTTLNYINYTPTAVSCQTTFFGPSGAALTVPFPSGGGSARTDALSGGASIHVGTNANSTAIDTGWAQVQCSGPIKASVLFRSYAAGAAVSEAGVNGMLAPATKFVTFAETLTGAAYSNPNSQAAQVTVTAIGSNGARLGSRTTTLPPGAHQSSYFTELLGVGSFSGSAQITSDIPIVSLALNGEAPPILSSLPPGELGTYTPLAPGF